MRTDRNLSIQGPFPPFLLLSLSVSLSPPPPNPLHLSTDAYSTSAANLIRIRETRLKFYDRRSRRVKRRAFPFLKELSSTPPPSHPVDSDFNVRQAFQILFQYFRLLSLLLLLAFYWFLGVIALDFAVAVRCHPTLPLNFSVFTTLNYHLPFFFFLSGENFRSFL